MTITRDDMRDPVAEWLIHKGPDYCLEWVTKLEDECKEGTHMFIQDLTMQCVPLHETRDMTVFIHIDTFYKYSRKGDDITDEAAFFAARYKDHLEF